MSIAREIIQTASGNYVLIDTSPLFFPVGDMTFETMVFKCNEKGNVKKKDYIEYLDVDRYGNKADAIAGHNAILEKWRDK